MKEGTEVRALRKQTWNDDQSRCEVRLKRGLYACAYYLQTCSLLLSSHCLCVVFSLNGGYYALNNKRI